MAGSRLTVRTLAMATVALGLACVHAARGDGRSGSVNTFSTTGGSNASKVATFSATKKSGTSSIVTTRGDVVKDHGGRSKGHDSAAMNQVSATARRNAAAAGVNVPGGAVAGRPGRSGKPSTLVKTPGGPAIEVRKVSVMSDGTEVVEPRRVAMAVPPSDAALDAELKKLSSTPRNAFALPGLSGASTSGRTR